MAEQKNSAILCTQLTPSAVLNQFLTRNKLTVGSTLAQEEIFLLAAKLFVDGYTVMLTPMMKDTYAKITILEPTTHFEKLNNMP